MPTANLGRVQPIFRGAYSAITAYRPLDIVTSNGTVFFCTANTTGNAPPNASFWAPLNDVGIGLNQIPSNQLLGSGTAVQSAAFDSYGNYALAKQVTQGPGFSNVAVNYVLLIPWGGATGTGYVHARFQGRRVFASNAAVRAVEFDITAIRDDSAKMARLNNGEHTFNISTYRPTLVTVDYAGVNWLAIKLVQDSAFRPLAVHAFVGRFDGQANQLLSVGASEISNEVAWETSAANIIGTGGWFGRPGDAIGYNGAVFSSVVPFGSGVDAGRIEAGTWTPVLAGSTTPGAHTYTTQLGSYVRQGRLMQVSFDIQTSAFDPAAAGNAIITGLPFAVNTPTGATQGATHIPIVRGITRPADTYSVLGIASASQISLQTIAGNPAGAAANLAVTAFAAGINRISGTLTYRAANT